MLDNWFTFFAGVGVASTLFLIVAILAISLKTARRRQSTTFLSKPEPSTIGAVPVSERTDEALMAVIMAAICAASGASSRDFKIVSISPTSVDSGFNTPIWGWIERIPRA